MKCCSEETIRLRYCSAIALNGIASVGSKAVCQEPLLATLRCSPCDLSVTVVVHRRLPTECCNICGKQLECDIQS
jgi:hypothetical protein